MSFRVIVNQESCKGSGNCVEVCPVNVYEIGADGKAEPIHAGECLGCETCLQVCPTASIIIEEV
jgi:NAD-dependent dihydropyrimidine dehydrogenase PreA subunit